MSGETLEAIAGIIIGFAFLYFYVRQLVQSVRDLRRSREERILFFGLTAGVALTIGSCVAIERAAGVPFGTDPPSFTFRRALGVLFLVAYGVFVWRVTVYPGARERKQFVLGKLCSVCNRRLRPDRMHRPIVEGEGQADSLARHWFYACECGELTLYDPDGRARHVVDRSRQVPPTTDDSADVRPPHHPAENAPRR